MFPVELSWKLRRIETNNDESTFTKSYNDAEEGAQFHKKSLCLQLGDYEFTIFDSYGDGITPPGHYNLMLASGKLIAEGGQFAMGESTPFSIPFGADPSSMSSSPLSPR